jgi:hypothetical protein
MWRSSLRLHNPRPQIRESLPERNDCHHCYVGLSNVTAVWIIMHDLTLRPATRGQLRISFLRIHLTNELHWAEPFLRSRQLHSHSRISQHFMETEGSLPCSQEPSTGPYPAAEQSSPVHTTPSYLSKIHLNIILPPTSVFLVESSPPCVLHALPTSSSLTWSL